MLCKLEICKQCTGTGHTRQPRQRNAVNKKASIIWEHSSALEQHVKLYELIHKKSEYKVRMDVIHTPLEVIRQRLGVERDSGRYLPEHYITERTEKLNILLPEYKKCVPVHLVEGTL